MVLVPASVLGLFVVFGLGYALTELVLSRVSATYRDSGADFKPQAVAGGLVLVALLILTLFILPRERVLVIWMILIGVGAAAALFLNAQAERARNQQAPPFTAKRPGGQRPGGQRPGGQRPGGQRPGGHPRRANPATGSGERPGPARAGPAPGPGPVALDPGEDPYRVLMAKVSYDQGRADELIAAERARQPLASLDDLCRTILSRWK